MSTETTKSWNAKSNDRYLNITLTFLGFVFMKRKWGWNVRNVFGFFITSFIIITFQKGVDEGLKR